MESPQVETANTLTIDYADNPDLREIFGRKEVGDKCTIKVELQVMSKYPEGVQCAIEKVITEGSGSGYDEGKKEAKADEKEPIMMRMKAKNSKNRGMMGPHGTGDHGRPPQTAQNSNEPWMTSYV